MADGVPGKIVFIIVIVVVIISALSTFLVMTAMYGNTADNYDHNSGEQEALIVPQPITARAVFNVVDRDIQKEAE